ncbi:AAA family ATPase [Prosthecobacter dejongeii]|uniref:DNA repair exonuclease SbcCD ATPase subunit n=1 Tax=Prosthecobacter dejongeii TaxID=48465 RepID=A0A7W7YP78_9BACT|nr:AAA family ATPase [Prosthecobacter dejongeii]MBB5039811.1 DNA repair exonuclease SbcCD ATPase subunit [Prosthecobacter dejongeii]
MRLHSITVRHYRRHKELRVDLDPERTLIGGANESGKSTLVEAAHRALFLKAKGNSKEHREMLSLTHGGKPEVEVEFEAAGKQYSLTKSFKGASGITRLVQASGPTWQGDEAEEKLAYLLQASGRKVAEQWNHLWVWQGSSSDDPLDQANAERESLVQRLQSHGGAAVIQSALDTQVADHFATQIKALFQDKGEPRKNSALGLAIQAEEEALETEKQAQNTLQNLQHAITQHEQSTAHITEAEAALKHLETEQSSLLRRSLEITRLRQLEQEHIRTAQEMLRTYETRLGAEQKISELRRVIAGKRASLTPQAEKLASLRHTVTSTQQLLEAAEEALRQSDQLLLETRARHDLAQALSSRLEKTQILDRLKARSKQIEALQTQRTQIEQQADRLPKVDATALRQLQSLERAHDKAQASLAGVATEIEVLTSTQSLQVGEKTLTTGQRLTLTDETELTLGDTRLRIRPGGGTSLAEARQQEQETQRQLQEALLKLGVKTLTEASTAQASREHLQSEWKTVNAELRGLDSEKFAAEWTTAERELIAAQAEVERRQTKEALDTPDLALSQRHLREAEINQEACRKQREVHQSAFKKAEAALAQHGDSTRALETEITQLETRLIVLVEHEGEDLLRTQALQQAQLQHEAAEAQVTTTRQSLSQHQPEHLEADQARFDRAWKAQNDKRAQANEKRIAAAALLQNDGSSDPAASLALAQARRQSAQAHRESTERHAQALRHVHELILEEQQILADQFTRPLAERVTGYLQRLFGTDVQATVTLEENQFQGLTLSRNNQSAFSFDSLSQGAREQVAAAFRLALAEILAEAHDGTLPVVFDDAFAHSDPDRVQNLQRMLDLAATRGLQIILLTCTPGDYALMGAKEIRLS